MLDLDVCCRVYRIILSFAHDYIFCMIFLVLTFGGNTHTKRKAQDIQVGAWSLDS
jgi:hypothetical protein